MCQNSVSAMYAKLNSVYGRSVNAARAQGALGRLNPLKNGELVDDKLTALSSVHR